MKNYKQQIKEYKEEIEEKYVRAEAENKTVKACQNILSESVLSKQSISVAVCIPFFLYCLLPFIGRALSGYTTLFNLIPTILTNVQASVKVPLIYQIGNCVFRQIPLVMVMYTVMAIALLPFIYKSFRRYGNK